MKKMGLTCKRTLSFIGGLVIAIIGFFSGLYINVSLIIVGVFMIAGSMLVLGGSTAFKWANFKL